MTPWNIWCSLPAALADRLQVPAWPLGRDAGLCCIAGWEWSYSSSLSLSPLEGFTSGALMVLPCPWRHCCPSLQPSVIVTFGEKGFSAQGLTFSFLSQGPLHSFCKFAHPVSRNHQALHICGYSLPCTRIKFHFIRPLN